MKTAVRGNLNSMVANLAGARQYIPRKKPVAFAYRNIFHLNQVVNYLLLLRSRPRSHLKRTRIFLIPNKMN